MDAIGKYDYWLEHAKYDMDTAKTMLDGGGWLYVAFMCQQAVEKYNRYPNYRMDLSAQINATMAADIYARTKEVFAWLQTLKP